jgi:hypothetical protein
MTYQMSIVKFQALVDAEYQGEIWLSKHQLIEDKNVFSQQVLLFCPPTSEVIVNIIINTISDCMRNEILECYKMVVTPNVETLVEKLQSFAQWKNPCFHIECHNLHSKAQCYTNLLVLLQNKVSLPSNYTLQHCALQMGFCFKLCEDREEIIHEITINIFDVALISTIRSLRGELSYEEWQVYHSTDLGNNQVERSALKRKFLRFVNAQHVIAVQAVQAFEGDTSSDVSFTVNDSGLTDMYTTSGDSTSDNNISNGTICASHNTACDVTSTDDSCLLLAAGQNVVGDESGCPKGRSVSDKSYHCCTGDYYQHTNNRAIKHRLRFNDVLKYYEYVSREFGGFED